MGKPRSLLLSLAHRAHQLMTNSTLRSPVYSLELLQVRTASTMRACLVLEATLTRITTRVTKGTLWSPSLRLLQVPTTATTTVWVAWALAPTPIRTTKTPVTKLPLQSPGWLMRTARSRLQTLERLAHALKITRKRASTTLMRTWHGMVDSSSGHRVSPAGQCCGG